MRASEKTIVKKRQQQIAKLFLHTLTAHFLRYICKCIQQRDK